LKISTRGKVTALFLVACLGLSAGCAGSPSSRFYTLTSLKSSGAKTDSTSAEQGPIVAIGPVVIPDYLYRPQIVTRSDGNEIRLNETERWAGSLQEDVSRVLVENLSILLAGDHVVVLRWEQAVLYHFPIKYRIGVEFVRFEGTVGGTVDLRTRYTVYGRDGKEMLSIRESTIREPVGGPDYEALTAAMSRSVAAVSKEITAALRAN